MGDFPIAEEFDADCRRFYTASVTLPARRHWLCLLLVLGAAPFGMAATVIFQNGQISKEVKIASETETHISIIMPEGLVRFPRVAIKSIDGRPVNEPAPTPVPAAIPTPKSPAESAPQYAPAPPAPAPAEPVAAGAVKPALPEVEVELPVADEPPAPPYEHKWNFEWVLLGLLVFSGVWMRSLQWVQKDLFDRQGDPRFWSTWWRGIWRHTQG